MSDLDSGVQKNASKDVSILNANDNDALVVVMMAYFQKAIKNAPFSSWLHELIAYLYAAETSAKKPDLLTKEYRFYQPNVESVTMSVLTHVVQFYIDLREDANVINPFQGIINPHFISFGPLLDVLRPFGLADINKTMRTIHIKKSSFDNDYSDYSYEPHSVLAAAILHVPPLAKALLELPASDGLDVDTGIEIYKLSTIYDQMEANDMTRSVTDAETSVNNVCDTNLNNDTNENNQNLNNVLDTRSNPKNNSSVIRCDHAPLCSAIIRCVEYGDSFDILEQILERCSVTVLNPVHQDDNPILKIVNTLQLTYSSDSDRWKYGNKCMELVLKHYTPDLNRGNILWTPTRWWTDYDLLMFVDYALNLNVNYADPNRALIVDKPDKQFVYNSKLDLREMVRSKYITTRNNWKQQASAGSRGILVDNNNIPFEIWNLITEFI